jgi:hypothetical protein
MVKDGILQVIFEIYPHCMAMSRLTST